MVHSGNVAVFSLKSTLVKDVLIVRFFSYKRRVSFGCFFFAKHVFLGQSVVALRSFGFLLRRWS